MGKGVQIRRGRHRAGRIVRAIDDDEARARRYGRAHAIPVVAKFRQLQRQPHGARTRQPDGGIVGVVRWVEQDDLICRADRCLNDRVKRFRGAERNSDFRFWIRRDVITLLDLVRDLRTQIRGAFHRRVLIVSGCHRGRHELRNARVDIVVGKSLPEVERAQLARTARHDGEYRRADVGQLAGDGHVRRQRLSGGGRERRTNDSGLTRELRGPDLGSRM